MFAIYRNLKGEIIEHTPETHPYNYDSFVTYKAKNFGGNHSSVDSDRMLSQDREKFQKSYKKIWETVSHTFEGKTPEDINSFLNLYFEREIKLDAVIQNCNVATGFPYWTFIMRKETDSTATKGE